MGRPSKREVNWILSISIAQHSSYREIKTFGVSRNHGHSDSACSTVASRSLGNSLRDCRVHPPPCESEWTKDDCLFSLKDSLLLGFTRRTSCVVDIRIRWLMLHDKPNVASCGKRDANNWTVKRSNSSRLSRLITTNRQVPPRLSRVMPTATAARYAALFVILAKSGSPDRISYAI